jgi:peptidoglycan/LPS O-acetylase OafA/YrhL
MENTPLSYIPTFDGLRAVAIFGVLVEHFCPSTVLRGFGPGGVGVTLFFVLSGYLITRILILYRGLSPTKSASRFYCRRFIRLSPPFYLAIFVAYMLNIFSMQNYWWIHGLYLTNFLIGFSGHWTGSADHFWTLCTEEQFYLIWFVVVVLLPPRFLLAAIFSACLITLLFRSYIYYFNLSQLSNTLLPGNIASLAIGGLLVEVQTNKRLDWVYSIVNDRRWLAATTVLFLAVSVSMRYVDLPQAIFYPFVASTFCACLISIAASKQTPPWLGWLGWDPIRHIGKISYGIYVYHMFLPLILVRIPSTHWVADGGWTTFAFLMILSVIVAHLSWAYIESPILRYKDRVPFVRKPSLSLDG